MCQEWKLPSPTNSAMLFIRAGSRVWFTDLWRTQKCVSFWRKVKEATMFYCCNPMCYSGKPFFSLWSTHESPVWVYMRLSCGTIDSFLHTQLLLYCFIIYAQGHCFKIGGIIRIQSLPHLKQPFSSNIFYHRWKKKKKKKEKNGKRRERKETIRHWG